MSGIFTATEAGVVACVYGLIVGLFIYKSMKLKDLYEICIKATRSCGMILMVLATASILTFMFIIAVLFCGYLAPGIITFLPNLLMGSSY